MNNGRLKQFAASFFVVLSLLVSSVSACTCSRHQETFEADSFSSHHHLNEAKTQQHHGTDTAETIQTIISEIECCCIQPAPKFVTKSETVKIEKQTATLLPTTRLKIDFAPHVVLTKTAGFIKPFYLSDFFYILTPGRAPPRL